ncbi:hypothetical protein OSB04_un000821 [Centaurea solstitialis]|uniref:Uncharacterized protein n=1 Tax=Centaurea solstitialis TaxID=347529 RepID=A0AA38W298_9ASTR|nr:hypothetical protein OSB04_un000821 [Centaurea solstitialis]
MRSSVTVRCTDLSDAREAASSSSNPSGGELTIEGDGKRLPEVSTLAKARKHVPHRGSNFLAYVVDSRAEAKKKTVADVSVVSEYRDVFPNDLPGILPEKQVEYRIERVLGTAPIAKARTGSHVVLEDRSSLGVPPVEVREEDALETALRARYGHAESIAMPFGLTNAPPCTRKGQGDSIVLVRGTAESDPFLERRAVICAAMFTLRNPCNP